MNKIKKPFILLVAYLHVLLFTYAAASKLFDYPNFLIQIGQSPLLAAFAQPVAIGVPVIELVIVVILCFEQTRTTGLLAAYILMVMFTAYIFIILNYSDYVPCSCGGVLEKMGWTEHLTFNCIFAVLALLAFLLAVRQSSCFWSRLNTSISAALLAAVTLIAVGTIILLFIISDKHIQQRNSFIRRFALHVLPENKTIDLKVNSYYFAGSEDGLLYLGNYTAPFTVTVVDTALNNSRLLRIKPDRILDNYKALHLRTLQNQFYITDGTIPCLYQGSTADWKATIQSGIPNKFTLAEPVGSDKIAFRQLSAVNESNILGLFSSQDSVDRKVNRDLLVKQQAGFFDTDGMLLYNQQREQIIYVYYYRNEYLSIDKRLELLRTGRTIDTVTKAGIETRKLENGETIMAKPPVVINKAASTFQNLLFIQSDRIGRFDRAEKLKKAALIDIYDLDTGNYQASFYLANIGTEKIKSFQVVGNKVYYLCGNHLAVLRLTKKITRHYKEHPSE